MIKGRKSFCTLIFLFTVLFFAGTPNLFAQNKSSVSIENARKTSYYTDETTGEEIIIFTGGVQLSVKQNQETTIISADTIHFNRSRNMLYAEGSVYLQKTGGGKNESMEADSLLLNVDTQEGIFNGAQVEQSGTDALNVPSGSTMIVNSDIFGRDDSGAIVFKKGALSFCDEPNPHWKIKASRIWLLPGNEFAFANALLFVGHVPVMYFPFFYYPKDELIFNPVFGYHPRKGYFIQSTTYFIGRKPLNTDTDEDSFLSFMKPTTLKKQRREGLILRNLDQDDKESYPNTLKLMADYYTNLGGMVGVDGKFKPKDSNINELDVSLYLGMSRTVFPFNQDGISVYTPYGTDGETHYNKSYFFGLELPFRLKGNFKFSMTSPFSISLSIPIYSDPFFDADFLTDRKENMDWLDFLMSNPEDETTTSSTGELSSFSWTLTSSYSPKLTKVKPYLNTLSFTPTSSMIFSAKTDTQDLALEEVNISPSRRFFYPSQVKPIGFSMKISGTLVSYPRTQSSSGDSGKSWKVPHLSVPKEFLSLEDKNSLQVQGIEDATTIPAAQEATDDSKIVSSEVQISEDNDLQKDEPTEESLNLQLPLLPLSKPSISKISGITYSLGYTLSPVFTTELAYDAPETRDGFQWDNIKSSFYKITSPVTVNSNFGYRDSFLSLSNNFSFNPIFQRHPEFNSETGKETAIKNDYTSQKLDLTNTNSLSFKPFVYNPIFNGTSLSWNTGIKLIRTSFVGTVDEPEWDYQLPEWDNDSFSNHTLNLNFSAQEGDFYQRLTLSTNLPPMVDTYTGTLSLGFPYFSTSVSSGIKQKSEEDESWVFNPIVHTASLNLFSNKLTLSHNFRYDLEEDTPSSYSLTLSGFNLKLAYSMLYTNNYEYDPSSGWKTQAEKEFQPVYLSLSYNNSGKFTYLDDKISFIPSISTELYYNMQRPTSSYFTFTPSITFKINELLDISFSASSRNQVIYRYIQEYTGFEPQIPGETNLFKDLINSFAFGNDKLRESSGFKLKSLNITLTHDLHDWELASDFEIQPRILTEDGKSRYDFSPKFTLSVLWKPMESIKTTIQDEYGTFLLNP